MERLSSVPVLRLLALFSPKEGDVISDPWLKKYLVKWISCC